MERTSNLVIFSTMSFWQNGSGIFSAINVVCGGVVLWMVEKFRKRLWDSIIWWKDIVDVCAQGEVSLVKISFNEHNGKMTKFKWRRICLTGKWVQEILGTHHTQHYVLRVHKVRLWSNYGGKILAKAKRLFMGRFPTIDKWEAFVHFEYKMCPLKIIFFSSLRIYSYIYKVFVIWLIWYVIMNEDPSLILNNKWVDLI